MFWNNTKDKLEPKWQWGAFGAFLVMLVVNALAGSTTTIGGVDTATVSDSYPNLFAPAGVTFSIWGVIYLLLGLFFFRVFGIWNSKKSALPATAFAQVVKLFTISSVLNVAWLFAWQYKVLWLSVILMVALLVTLGMIVHTMRNIQLPLQEYAITKLPFSVYFAWITVATIANITTWLVSINWDALGLRPGIWMVGIVLVGATIGIVTALRNNDAPYLTVFVWAFAGILLKHLSGSFFNGQYPSTIVALTICLAVFISVVIPMYQRMIATKVA